MTLIRDDDDPSQLADAKEQAYKNPLPTPLLRRLSAPLDQLAETQGTGYTQLADAVRLAYPAIRAFMLAGEGEYGSGPHDAQREQLPTPSDAGELPPLPPLQQLAPQAQVGVALSGRLQRLDADGAPTGEVVTVPPGMWTLEHGYRPADLPQATWTYGGEVKPDPAMRVHPNEWSNTPTPADPPLIGGQSFAPGHPCYCGRRSCYSASPVDCSPPGPGVPAGIT